MNVGETASATVSLNNVPAEGFTSAEFTCTYDASRIDEQHFCCRVCLVPIQRQPSMVRKWKFIVAIAGSKGQSHYRWDCIYL